MSPTRRDGERTEPATAHAERLARIRREVAEGTYESEEKLAAAVAALEKQIARQQPDAVQPSPKRPK